MVVRTTRDVRVRPRKQLRLAAALRARLLSIDGDHDTPITHAERFGEVMREAILHLADGLVEQSRPA